MDITKLSETELKALKSDIYETISQQQTNLQIINQELEKRKSKPEQLDENANKKTNPSK